MKIDELPKLSELEAELLTVREVYSEADKVIDRPRVSKRTFSLCKELYEEGKGHGLKISDLGKLDALRKRIEITYERLKKAHYMHDKLNQVTNCANFRTLGIDEAKGYEGVVGQVVERYATCIINAYQTAGHLGDLSATLREIKETRLPKEYLEKADASVGHNFMKKFRKIGENLYTAHSFFERVQISSEEIERYAPLTNCNVLVHILNTNEDMQPYLVVPGTYGIHYHNDGAKTGMLRAIVEKDSLNLAMKIVNALYLKTKELNQAERK